MEEFVDAPALEHRDRLARRGEAARPHGSPTPHPGEPDVRPLANVDDEITHDDVVAGSASIEAGP